MRASAVDCQARMDRLKDFIVSEQQAEQAEVYDLLAKAKPAVAMREWMLMKDRHSRSKQDLWALKRELKQVHHKVTTSSRELQQRIAMTRPTTASASLIGSYSGVLGRSMVNKAAQGKRSFGDMINNFASGVALQKFTHAGIKRFHRNSQMILTKHQKGQEKHHASMRGLLPECYT